MRTFVPLAAAAVFLAACQTNTLGEAEQVAIWKAESLELEATKESRKAASQRWRSNCDARHCKVSSTWAELADVQHLVFNVEEGRARAWVGVNHCPGSLVKVKLDNGREFLSSEPALTPSETEQLVAALGTARSGAIEFSRWPRCGLERQSFYVKELPEALEAALNGLPN